MFLELHILQNFAPSNLNRDDTGAPKDCEFGGYRRARISSQCIKRAIRESFRDGGLVARDRLAVRTKLLRDELIRSEFFQRHPEDERARVAEAALGGVGLGVTEDGKTQYLLFLAGIQRLAESCHAHWKELLALGATVEASEKTAGKAAKAPQGEKRSAKEKKKAAQQAVPAAIKDSLERALYDVGKAVDLALFGRMVADLPEHNVDAACQVAHAISTHRVGMEFDFYTAVDELNPEETTGAGMMGTIGFNSACFYRYSNIEFGQLATNLGDERRVAVEATEAFLRASVVAVPGGKQNSMAAHNPPSLVMAVLRDGGLWSLANAFLDPVRPDRDGDLVKNSVKRLDRYWGQLEKMYGTRGVRGTWVALLEEDGLETLAATRVASVEELISRVVGSLRAGETS